MHPGTSSLILVHPGSDNTPSRHAFKTINKSLFADFKSIRIFALHLEYIHEDVANRAADSHGGQTMRTERQKSGTPTLHFQTSPRIARDAKLFAIPRDGSAIAG